MVRGASVVVEWAAGAVEEGEEWSMPMHSKVAVAVVVDILAEEVCRTMDHSSKGIAANKRMEVKAGMEAEGVEHLSVEVTVQ